MSEPPQTQLLAPLYQCARAIYERLNGAINEPSGEPVGDDFAVLTVAADEAADLLDLLSDLDNDLDAIEADEAKRLHDEHLQYLADQADAASY